MLCGSKSKNALPWCRGPREAEADMGCRDSEGRAITGGEPPLEAGIELSCRPWMPLRPSGQAM